MTAYLHCQHFVIAKQSHKELHSCKSSPRETVNSNNRASQLKKRHVRVVQCCSVSSSPSSSICTDKNLNLDSSESIEPYNSYENNRLRCGSLVTDVNWKVRRMIETDEEMRKVADIQAEAFHEPVILFDDLFFDFFKAEVLSGLLYRLRNSPSDRYACLVAEPANDTQEPEKELVGVVDVTVFRDDSVLHHLPGADEYLYVSGIAVSQKFRRQKVGTTLLKACDELSKIWGFEYLVLRAYEDDHGAQTLYSNAGYRVVSRDPPWTTSWIGRRRRVLMVKRTDL